MTKKCPTCKAIYPDTMRKCPIDRTRLMQVSEVDPLLGQVLDGRYTIMKNLGSGAVGAVYQVEHVTLKKSYAAKILYKNMRPKSIKRFEREALAASKIDHPNIVQTIDFGYDESLGHYCILEYLQGETLHDRMRRVGQMRASQILPLIQQLGRGLQVAHDAGIIHRDLKPTNCFIQVGSEAETMKILDFGLAKLLDEQELEELSHTGQVLGTPSYMAPEQTKGVEHVDHRADIYSMGLILYRMVTGRRPFEARSVPEVMHLQLTADPKPADEVAPGNPASKALKPVLTKALKKKPEQRYQSSRAFVEAVEAAIDAMDSDETISGFPQPAGSATDTSPIEDSREPEKLQSLEMAKMSSWQAIGNETFGGPSPGSQGARWSLILIIVLAIVGGIVGGLFLLKRNGTPTPQQPAPGTNNVLPAPKGKRPLLVVAPFENRTRTEDLQWLRVGLTDMFIAQLTQDSGVSVLSRQRLGQLLLRHKDKKGKITRPIYALAHRVKGRFVLWGSYSKVGAMIQLTLSLEDLRSKKVILSQNRQMASIREVTRTVDDLAEKVRYRLTGKKTPKRQGARRRLSTLRTANMQAYRAFIRADMAFNESKYVRALSLYKEAVTHDPAFMMARYGLALVYEFLDQRPKAREEMDNALKLVAGRSRGEMLLIQAAHAFLHNKMTVSLGYARKLFKLYPKDTYLLGVYAEILMHNLEIKEMLRVGRRIQKLDPNNGDGWEYQVLALSELGRHDKSIDMARRFVQSTRSPRSQEFHARALYRAGRYAEALKLIGSLAKVSRSRWLNDLENSVLLSVGQCKKAIEKLQNGDLKSDDPVIKANALVTHGEVLIKLGLLEPARAKILEALKVHKLPYVYLFLGRVALGLKQPAIAKDALEKIKKSDVGSWDRDAEHLLRAEILLYDKKYDEAEREFRLADQKRMVWDRGPNGIRSLLARVSLKRGDHAGCLKIVKKMLRYNSAHPDAWWMRARCLELAGKKPAALAAYKMYLQRMKGADAELLDKRFALKRIAELGMTQKPASRPATKPGLPAPKKLEKKPPAIQPKKPAPPKKRG